MLATMTTAPPAVCSTKGLTFGGPMTLFGGGSSSNENAPFFLLEKDMAPHTQVFTSPVMFSLGQQLVTAHCFCWRDGKHVK